MFFIRENRESRKVNLDLPKLYLPLLIHLYFWLMECAFFILHIISMSCHLCSPSLFPPSLEIYHPGSHRTDLDWSYSVLKLLLLDKDWFTPRFFSLSGNRVESGIVMITWIIIILKRESESILGQQKSSYLYCPHCQGYYNGRRHCLLMRQEVKLSSFWRAVAVGNLPHFGSLERDSWRRRSPLPCSRRPPRWAPRPRCWCWELSSAPSWSWPPPPIP